MSDQPKKPSIWQRFLFLALLALLTMIGLIILAVASALFSQLDSRYVSFNQTRTLILGGMFLVAAGWLAVVARMFFRRQGHDKRLRQTAALCFSGLVFLGFVAFAPVTISTTKDASFDSKARRNGQQLSAVFSAAQAAGLDFLDPDSLEDTITTVVAGGTISDSGSPFYKTFFGVPNLTEQEQEAAAEYLEIQNGILVYRERPASTD